MGFTSHYAFAAVAVAVWAVSHLAGAALAACGRIEVRAMSAARIGDELAEFEHQAERGPPGGGGLAEFAADLAGDSEGFEHLEGCSKGGDAVTHCAPRGLRQRG